jgi:hypothetical protein
MSVIADAIVDRAAKRRRRPDLAESPLPLGAPFGVPLAKTEAIKENPAVFGLTRATPYGAMIPAVPLEYDEDLQLSFCPLVENWDGTSPPSVQIPPSMRTMAGTIEPTSSTGTITATVDCGGPDRDRDSDPPDRARD